MRKVEAILSIGADLLHAALLFIAVAMGLALLVVWTLRWIILLAWLIILTV